MPCLLQGIRRMKRGKSVVEPATSQGRNSRGKKARAQADKARAPLNARTSQGRSERKRESENQDRSFVAWTSQIRVNFITASSIGRADSTTGSVSPTLNCPPLQSAYAHLGLILILILSSSEACTLPSSCNLGTSPTSWPRCTTRRIVVWAR